MNHSLTSGELNGAEQMDETRREFLAALAAAGFALPLLSCSDDDEAADGGAGVGDADIDANTDVDADIDTDGDTDTVPETDNGLSKVFVVRTDDRNSGLAALIAMVDLGFAAGKGVVLKPNFNSAEAFPASTHDDTIRCVVAGLKEAGAADITSGVRLGQ